MKNPLLFFCFMFVLAVAFGDTRSTSAHEMYTTTAQEASMGTMEDMRNFVRHVKEHRELLRSYDEHAEFRNAMRTNDGEWKSGTTYVITVNQRASGIQNLRAGEVISFHADQDLALDGSLRGIGVFERLMTEVEKSGQQPACVVDETGEHGNHICAVQTTLTSQTGARNTVYTVAGFDHEPDDVKFDKALAACPDLGPQYFNESGTDSNEESFTRVSAGTLDMAADRETLKNYVKTVEEHISTEIKSFREFLRERNPGYDQLVPEEVQRGHITARLARLRTCWRQETWNSGSIYFVLFRHAGKRYSVFNGLSPTLKDSTLNLYDGCVDVDQLIIQSLEEQDENNRFFEYYWSNPVKDDDIFDEDGNRIQGLSPGTSVKVGYVLPTTFGGETKANFVILSGIYPEDKEYYEPEGGTCHPIPDNLSALARDQLHKYPVPERYKYKDDGGCAIASGDRSNLKVAGFNLFLLTVVLFSAILGRSRSGEKF